jgi:hypothetical protein
MALKPQGNNIVGGTSLVIDRINSPNYVTGVSGWTINQDGSAEFNNVTIRGGTTIGGTSLWYSTATPQANTLVESVSSTAFIDSAGNYVLAGHAAYHFAPVHFSVAVAVTDLGVIWYSATAGTLGPWTEVQSITVNATNGLLTLSNAVVTGQLTATGGTSANPTLITTDTWNMMTLDAGWTTGVISRPAPRYRLLPDGNLQLSGAASAVAGSGGKTLNNGNPLPAPYRPLQPCDFYSSDSVGSRMHISIATNGVLSANFPAGASGTWFAEINGIVPLN